MALDIVCLGEPLVEFNEQADGNYLKGFGGDVCNCAVTAARLGAKTGLVTRLGADNFGAAILAMLRDEGIDTSRIARDDEAPTGIYFVTHDANGHHFEYRRSGSAASLLDASRIPGDYIRDARLLHVSGISQAISSDAADAVQHAVGLAHDAGRLVSYDTNLRLQLWPVKRARSVMHATIASCDILLPGLDDAIALTGKQNPEAIVDYYLGLGPAVVALTLGEAGVLVGTPHERHLVPAIPAVVVDATGAGDAFDGAFLTEYLATGDVLRAATFANAACALAVQGYGATAANPRRAAVIELLAEYSRSGDDLSE
ncbi:MAG: sugar kinase [Gammaproteobacteria bacterium]|nr:sugar kinase [Gammaproteobacteria bacterium]